VGTVRILYGVGTISLQAAVHPKYMLGALNMKEEEPCTYWANHTPYKVYNQRFYTPISKQHEGEMVYGFMNINCFSAGLMPTTGQTLTASQNSHITLWSLSPTLLYSYTNHGINFIYHGPVTCLCYTVMYLECSNISSTSIHTSQRTQAHKSRCETLTHTKGMISYMIGIKSKSQGHFQYTLLFNCLVGVLRGEKSALFFVIILV